MIRYYCDICKHEIEAPCDSVRLVHGRITVEIRRSVDGTWNAGHVCTPCLLTAVSHGVVTR